jgi:glutamyl/glutaminyl-tRNA synthetase
MKTPAQKLSKSDRDTGVRDLRDAGWTAARVVTHAARLAGLVDGVAAIGAKDAGALFSA